MECHQCHAPLTDDYVATEMVGRSGPRARLHFCRVRCLMAWAQHIVAEADKHLAAMKAKGN